MAAIGENVAKAMVYERDFFRSRDMTATGITTQHALKVFKLKSYESKGSELFTLTQCLMLLECSMQFTAYKNRAMQL